MPARWHRFALAFGLAGRAFIRIAARLSAIEALSLARALALALGAPFALALRGHFALSKRIDIRFMRAVRDFRLMQRPKVLRMIQLTHVHGISLGLAGELSKACLLCVFSDLGIQVIKHLVTDFVLMFGMPA